MNTPTRDDVSTPSRETFRIASPLGTALELFVLRQPPVFLVPTRCPVLYVHGATFPSDLAVGFRFDGFSWMDDLAQAGFDTWAFDFLGYGESSRYPQFNDAPSAHPPLGRARSAADQLAAVVQFVLQRTGYERLHLIAHSWGTQPTCLFASERPEYVERLVLFGPILQRQLTNLPNPESLPAHRLVTVDEQWKRFVEDVPHGEPPVLLRRHFDSWASAYLASDAQSGVRTPPAVKIPTGPNADILASWSGALPYRPSAIQAPTLLVRGEWDSLCTDADAQWLRCAMTNAATLHDVKIPRATHLMHLEEGRFELHRATREFLTVNPSHR